MFWYNSETLFTWHCLIWAPVVSAPILFKKFPFAKTLSRNDCELFLRYTIILLYTLKKIFVLSLFVNNIIKRRNFKFSVKPDQICFVAHILIKNKNCKCDLYKGTLCLNFNHTRLFPTHIQTENTYADIFEKYNFLSYILYIIFFVILKDVYILLGIGLHTILFRCNEYKRRGTLGGGIQRNSVLRSPGSECRISRHPGGEDKELPRPWITYQVSCYDYIWGQALFYSKFY